MLAGAAIYTLVTGGRESTDDAQVTADMVPIAARVAGPVLHVHVIENQAVKRGDLLVEIDPADYQTRVQQAQAEVDTAKAQAAAADAQVRIVEATSKGGFATARAALSGSAAGVLGRRRPALGRQGRLGPRRRRVAQGRARPQSRQDLGQGQRHSRRAISIPPRSRTRPPGPPAPKPPPKWRWPRNRAGRAQSRVGEAQGRLSQSAPIEPQIAAARANADLAAARVRAAEAALAMAKLQLGYTKVVAPADGYASKLTAHEGQLVTTGQPVLELIPFETYLLANFKETQIGKMHPGQPATIEVDALPGQKLEGKVESLSGGTGSSFSLLPADNATGNFVKVVQRVPVRIAWVRHPGDATILRAGLSADVTVDTRK